MSEKYILKRDGSEKIFDESRIYKAIARSFSSAGLYEENIVSFLLDQVNDNLEKYYFLSKKIPGVEEIQDIVEDVLMQNCYHRVAKNYILYRARHKELRNLKTEFDQSIDLIDDYLGQEDWRVKENSNMAYSLQGLNIHISSKIISQYWLRKLYDSALQEAHEEGWLHIHDLGILGPYCVGWDLEDLLIQGFQGARGKVTSSPAKHFRTALGQIVNFFYTLQGEAAGAQAFSNLDTLLAPFIFYDKLDYRQVKQALQEFIFNINVPTRAGFQTPFTNVTLDLKVPALFKDKGVIIGGQLMDKTYGEFQSEMDLFNSVFAEIMMEGDANGRIFTFPIPTYNITKDFDWGNDALQKIWQMTAKYGIPYFANFVNSEMDPEDARSMCCRLRLDNRELRRRGGGLFGANPLTGSLGVVTINMPRLGFVSRNKSEYFDHLSVLMDLARNSLEMKRKIIERYTEQGLYPYTSFYLRSVKESQGRYWNSHFSTIGLVGMHESVKNFLGVSILDEKGKAFSEEVLDFMRTRLQLYQEETGNLYNLEATPAESASYRLARLDRKRYPGIYQSGKKDNFYTNSVHAPVDQIDEDLFDILLHQDSLQTKFTGGTVVHLFFAERISDWRQVRLLTRKITENFSLPYFSFTPTFSVSPVSGYLAGKHHFDPNPMSDQDIDRFGIELEVNRKELDKLPEGSYRIISG